MLERSIHRRVWPDDGDFNHSLSRVILSRTTTEAGLQVTNVGGWHSEPVLHTWNEPVIQTLIERVAGEAAGCVGQVSRMQAWANVMRAGGLHLAHHHGGAVWSAVYYANAVAGHGGEIKFARGQEACIIAPCTGLMLMFPGDLLHSVERYVGPTARVSIAFNLW